MADVSIPANLTVLAQHGWINGTLDRNPMNEWSPAGNNSQPVNLTILPDNLAAVQFYSNEGQPFAQIFPLVRTLLSPEYYGGTIHCTYPVSGSYDFLTRILFYCLLLFALLFRRHSWLAVAALGTAMTYSATTAVHGLALLTQFGWHTGRPNMESSQQFGDPDIYGVYTILTAALVVATPILNWSTSVRRDKAQTIVVLWGLLVLATWIPITLYTSTAADGKFFHPWNFNNITALVQCPHSASESNPTCSLGMLLTMESYDTCQCFDFCGLAGPAAPMRSGAKMVPMLYSQATWDRFHSNTFMQIGYFAQAMAAVIVLYGIFGILHNQFTLREARNLILRVVNAHPKQTGALWKKVASSKNKRTPLVLVTEHTRTWFRKVQYVLAKTMAMLFFLLGMVLGFLCPPALIAVVIINEYQMDVFTPSEGSDAVGAWGTWVGAGLVIVVAIILQYQDAWEQAVLSIADWALQIIGIDTFHDKMEEKKKNPVDGKRKLETFTDYLVSFAEEVWSPWVHAGHSIHRALKTIIFACGEFGDWIRAPVPHSQICGCDRCVAYRDQVHVAGRPYDHADCCECPTCSTLKNQADDILYQHSPPSAPACGCQFCGFARERAIPKRQKGCACQRDSCPLRRHPCPCRHCELHRGKENEAWPANKSAEIKVYKTLGMRIVHSFDNRIIKLLAEKQASPPPSSTVGERQSPNVPDKGKGSTAVGAEEPLLKRGSAESERKGSTVGLAGRA
ncbi:hypothetical protein DM02DRAFT_616303 [Periconia macrospinosa]|uniref:Uncharacterized protein n=1 Tax=Periconia macrospinosa TaxID=97972 RepID=A0A2V1DII3_9PLEO|nr:hypothetical protein DM02DRAFT_616303 [Periconia macrospinosa]